MPAPAYHVTITAVPIILLLLAGTVWGGFAWVALGWLALGAVIADPRPLPPTSPAPRPDPATGASWSDRLAVGMAIGHILVLISTVTALAQGALSLGHGVALFCAAAAFFGQISLPNAATLLHGQTLAHRMLGAAVYTSLGLGHYVSVQRRPDHPNGDAEDDPKAPLPGEGLWDYLPRACQGACEAGLVHELDRLDRLERGPTHITNPYWIWVGGALLSVVVSLLYAGLLGPLVLIALAGLAGAQILLADYIRHYGLQRLILPNGRLEPMGPHHSWSAPRVAVSDLRQRARLGFKRPRQGEPQRGHPDAAPPGPILPFPMPLMSIIAMVPPLWRHAMDKRALEVMEAVQTARAQGAPLPFAGASGPNPVPADHRQTAPTEIATAPQSETAPTAANPVAPATDQREPADRPVAGPNAIPCAVSAPITHTDGGTTHSGATEQSTATPQPTGVRPSADEDAALLAKIRAATG